MTVSGYSPATGERDLDKVILGIRTTREYLINLGITSFIETLLNDADAATALSTLTANFPGCGILERSSSTAILFKPRNGNKIKIAGTWYDTPSAGITGNTTSVYIDGSSGQTLANSTVYNVYVFNNSGTLTIDYSTTAHATDTADGNVGTEIKSGVNTRTLVGKIRTNASGQFVDTAAQRWVISWFNKRPLACQGANTAGATTTSVTKVELATSSRAEFLSWGDGALLGLGGTSTNSAGANNYGNIGLNNATGEFAQDIASTPKDASSFGVVGSSGASTPSEGYNYITPLGKVSSGTGTFYLGAAAAVLG